MLTLVYDDGDKRARRDSRPLDPRPRPLALSQESEWGVIGEMTRNLQSSVQWNRVKSHFST